jgi:hypothetical protein
MHRALVATLLAAVLVGPAPAQTGGQPANAGQIPAAQAGGTAPAPARSKAAVRAPPKLSAEQIVARNAAARGGLEAWRKVETMMWMGHIESAHAPVPSVQFVLAQQRPNKTRFEVNAMGDRSLRVFDGAHGWKLRPGHGGPSIQPYSDEELRFAGGAPGIDGVLIDYAAKGSAVEVKGIDEIEKHKAYHLIVRTRAGESQDVWVDAKTFLEIRYDRPAAAGAGASRTVSVMYRDYKDTEGLKIPSVIETGAGAGNTPDRMVTEKVLLNPQLSAETFSEPGSARKSARPTGNRAPFPPHRPAGPRPGFALPSANPPPSAAPAPQPNPAPANTPQPDSPGSSSQDPGTASH